MGRRELAIYRAFDFLGERANMRDFNGRILFQKKVYFLQQFAGGLDYDFGWYTYGPYLYDVTTAGYKVQSWQNIDLDIPAADSIPREALESYRDFLRELRTLGDERYWLELLSSLHFVYQSAEPRPQNTVVFHVIETVKPNRFSQRDKETAWEMLRRYNLIGN